MEFETTAAAMRGEMTVTYTLTDADGDTDVLAIPDNQAGWLMVLDKLAALVERVRKRKTQCAVSSLAVESFSAVGLAQHKTSND